MPPSYLLIFHPAAEGEAAAAANRMRGGGRDGGIGIGSSNSTGVK